MPGMFALEQWSHLHPSFHGHHEKGKEGQMLQRSKRGWVWNQFFVIDEYTGPNPVLVGRVRLLIFDVDVSICAHYQCRRTWPGQNKTNKQMNKQTKTNKNLISSVLFLVTSNLLRVSSPVHDMPHKWIVRHLSFCTWLPSLSTDPEAPSPMHPLTQGQGFLVAYGCCEPWTVTWTIVGICLSPSVQFSVF